MIPCEANVYFIGSLQFFKNIFKVLNEADIDGDHRMSANEFEHVITKSPDFLTTFHFRI